MYRWCNDHSREYKPLAIYLLEREREKKRKVLRKIHGLYVSQMCGRLGQMRATETILWERKCSSVRKWCKNGVEEPIWVLANRTNRKNNRPKGEMSKNKKTFFFFLNRFYSIKNNRRKTVDFSGVFFFVISDFMLYSLFSRSFEWIRKKK